jgi:hypothetical protein
MAFYTKNMDNINDRINIFWAGISTKNFGTFEEFGKAIILILIEAAQTDDNERINWCRKKWVNEHSIQDLEKSNSRITITKNACIPYSSDAANLYLHTVQKFNERKKRRFPVHHT